MALKQPDEALHDFDAAYRLQPSDPAITKALTDVREAHKSSQAKVHELISTLLNCAIPPQMQEMYQRMFAPR